jgi:uncharacterized protein (DUF2252 family)
MVGVGSGGLRAYVALLEGSSPDDVVFLQLKQARRSVLARHVHGESAWHAHHCHNCRHQLRDGLAIACDGHLLTRLDHIEQGAEPILRLECSNLHDGSPKLA